MLLAGYYYGPLSIEQLKKYKITGETLVCVEGTNNWKKIKDSPELLREVTEIKLPNKKGGCPSCG